MSRTTHEGTFKRITGLWPHLDLVGNRDGIYVHLEKQLTINKGSMILVLPNPGHVKKRAEGDEAQPSHILFVGDPT